MKPFVPFTILILLLLGTVPLAAHADEQKEIRQTILTISPDILKLRGLDQDFIQAAIFTLESQAGNCNNYTISDYHVAYPDKESFLKDEYANWHAWLKEIQTDVPNTTLFQQLRFMTVETVKKYASYMGNQVKIVSGCLGIKQPKNDETVIHGTIASNTNAKTVISVEFAKPLSSTDIALFEKYDYGCLVSHHALLVRFKGYQTLEFYMFGILGAEL